jgi:cell division protease FtsH
MSEFDKIIAYNDEKQTLMQICDMLNNKEVYAKLGVKVPHGVLIEGDPGIGKSLMAKCFIKESGLKYFLCKKDMPDGEFVDKITALFKEAKANAPSIIFFDDIDKFAEDCSDEGNSNKEEFVAIQAGIDDVKDSNVFVIATANDTKYLPESLLRVGRFDKRLCLEFPQTNDAIKIIEHFLSDKQVAEDIKAEEVVRLMSNNSCAELESVLNMAGVYAGYERKNKIEFNHIVKAVLEVIYNVVKNLDMSNTQHVKYSAYHEAGHCLVSLYYGRNNMGLVTLYSQGSSGGFYVKNSNNSLIDDYEYNIAVTLAGKAASEFKFGGFDVGASYDIEKAEYAIRNRIKNLGYNNFNYIHSTYTSLVSAQRCDATAIKVTEELNKYFDVAKAIIKRHSALLDMIAEKLIEKKVLTSRDTDKILDNYDSHGDGFHF